MKLSGQNYYRTSEVCRILNVSRNTLFRWMREGTFEEASYRDWRGWRLFSEGQVYTMKMNTSKVIRTFHK
ncbi:MAG: helix-turn-helix domain-containing protein [Dehalococcoidales bacterium]|nr:helix-turn-helix domain-containing protein [Dehalococcoidales bacterium]